MRLDLQTKQLTPLVKDRNLYQNIRFSRDGSTVVYHDVGWRSTGGSLRRGRRLPQPAQADRPQSVAGEQGAAVVRARRPIATPTARRSTACCAIRSNYQKGRRYPTVFEIYETFFDNGFNARAAFLANHGYAVFHPSVNLVVGRPGESWAKGVTSAANKLIDMGDRRSRSARRARHELRRLCDGAADHRDRSLQGGDQRLGQGRHGQLLHRQPAARRAQHARAGEEPGPHRRHAVGISGALSGALRDHARRSHQDAAAQHHRRPGSERAASQSREIYYALRRLGARWNGCAT